MKKGDKKHTIEIGEEEEEELAGRKRGMSQKKLTKKMKKGDKKHTIEIGESEEEKEEEMTKIKWKDFEVHQLIAINGKIDKEFTKITNK